MMAAGLATFATVVTRPLSLAMLGIMGAADEGLVYARTATAEYLTDYTLKELEERAAGSFVRLNRSEMVNIESIGRIESNGDGSATITLADGSGLRVARRRAAGTARPAYRRGCNPRGRGCSCSPLRRRRPRSAGCPGAGPRSGPSSAG